MNYLSCDRLKTGAAQGDKDFFKRRLRVPRGCNCQLSAGESDAKLSET